MPVILNKEQEKTWLTENNDNTLKNLITSYQSDKMLFHPISFEINSVKNNYPELTKAI